MRHPDIDASGAWVIVPAYDEARVIEITLKEVLQRFRSVVVVDDCSHDATGTLALKAGAHVVRHPVHLGQGAALVTGIVYALRKGASYVVTFDADGQHAADDALSMFELIMRSGCDVVLGSRFIGQSIDLPRSRRILLRVALLFTRTTTGLALTDTHNGLRVFTADAARAIVIRQNGMAHASEILSQIAALGLSYREAPCTIRYTDYSRAKGQRLSGALAILAALLAGRLYR